MTLFIYLIKKEYLNLFPYYNNNINPHPPPHHSRLFLNSCRCPSLFTYESK